MSNYAKFTQFKIRIVGSLSAAYADAATFEIVDTTNNLMCQYDYRGLTLSRSEFSPPVILGLRGPWNAFQSHRPIAVDDFGGTVKMWELASREVAHVLFKMEPLTLLPLPPIYIKRFKTGLTLGATAGFSTGILSCAFPHPVPFLR